MAHVFLDSNRRLRNGWWMLVFLGFIVLTRFAYRPLTRGLRDLGIGDPWLEPAAFLFTLLATWACTRLRREPLASVGFRLDRRWAREIARGALAGGAAMLAAAAMIWATGGVRFELDPARSAAALLAGAYGFLFVALFEENLYRGFLFQRLLDGTGAWFAQVSLALLFALAHWGNPGMSGATRVWATVDTALGAALLGLAYLRTRSLALPVGIHFGWNWVQGTVLGFGVSGFGQRGWLRPVLQDRAQWLSGGSFGPEASVFAVVVDVVALVVLWRWRGSAPNLPSAGNECALARRRDAGGQATQSSSIAGQAVRGAAVPT